MPGESTLIHPSSTQAIPAGPENPTRITAGGATVEYGTTSALGSSLSAGQAKTFTSPQYVRSAGAVLLTRYSQWDVDDDISGAEQGALNVKDPKFGATGDGVTDDTAAIQAAITAAGTNGCVYLPKGTYKLSGSITLLSGQTVVGDGATLDIFANASGLIGTSLSNITIQGMRFLGNGGTVDTGSGVELTTCSRVKVVGCHFEGMATSSTGGAGTVFNGCTQSVFANNTGLDAGYTLVNFFNCNGFTAVGNSHQNTRAAGVLSTCVYANSGSVDGVFAGNTSVNDTWPIEVRVGAKRITVVGNTIKGCKNQAIVVQSEGANLTSHVVVADNVIELATAATDGIFVDSTTHVTVKGNIVQGPATSAGILVTQAGTASNGIDTVVEGNIVRSSSEYGIRVASGCHRAHVIGNRVETTDDQRSISVEADDAIITGNYVYDSGWHAISVTGADPLITSNRIKTTRNSGEGIRHTGTGGLVANNVVTGSAGAALNIPASAKQHGNKLAGGASQGRAVLVAGTVTVSTTEVLAADNIHLTRVVTGGTTGNLSIGTITAGTSFVINSSSGTDTSTIFWEVVH